MQTICAIALCGVLAAVTQPGTGGSNAANLNASGPDADLTSVSTTVYVLSFHPEAGTLPSGAMYVCRARIMPSINTEHAAKNSDKVPGTQSGCALEVPFAWQANHPQPAVALSYEVDAIDPAGRVLRSVSHDAVALPAPAAGSSAHVELTF